MNLQKPQAPKPSPYAVPQFMKVIFAKFPSHCADTGRRIIRGEAVYYDPAGKRVFCPRSDMARMYDSQQEARQVRAYIEAQENAYFDNFARNL
jgi:hypothetical protein